jgi:hypothetical protein
VGAALIGVVLLVSLVIGLALEPDSGTAAQVGPPDIAGASVGANHAKPLPRLPLPSDLLLTALATLLLAVLARHGTDWAGATLVQVEEAPPPDPLRSRTRGRRGPPIDG